MKRFAFALLLGVAAFSSSALADVIQLPAGSSGSNGNSRGYWFTAPTAFTLTGVSVLGATGTEYAEIVRLNSGVPPTFSASTTDYTVLNYVSGAGAATIGINTSVSAGDIIGVLGWDSGCGCIHYGNGPFDTSIFGTTVTLTRFLTQQTLDSQAGAVSSESPGNLGLVQLTIASSAPEPASFGLVSLALVGAALLHRRRASF